MKTMIVSRTMIYLIRRDWMNWEQASLAMCGREGSWFCQSHQIRGHRIWGRQINRSWCCQKRSTLSKQRSAW
jgi:hypothetical protein